MTGPDGKSYAELNGVERAALRRMRPYGVIGADGRKISYEEWFDGLSPEHRAKWAATLARKADNCPCGCDGDEEECREARP